MAFAGVDFSDSDDQSEPVPLNWAKTFWRSNWKLYSCAVRPSDEGTETPDVEEARRGTMQQARTSWRERLDQLAEEFLTVARAANPDLYAPDKHEALTGIAYRVLRDLLVLIGYPALWAMEHGASYIRNLVEARIVFKWLVLKNDPELYSRFKSYGRGRLKLLELHLEEYRDGLGDPPSDLDAQIEYLQALVNQDIWKEFQEISIEGNFAGVDTRKMAEQVGILTEYRLIFAPASANVHGEWAALDQYALTVCKDPLHRNHRIPRDDARILLGPELVETALNHVSALVDDYVDNWSHVN